MKSKLLFLIIFFIFTFSYTTPPAVSAQVCSDYSTCNRDGDQCCGDVVNGLTCAPNSCTPGVNLSCVFLSDTWRCSANPNSHCGNINEQCCGGTTCTEASSYCDTTITSTNPVPMCKQVCGNAVGMPCCPPTDIFSGLNCPPRNLMCDIDNGPAHCVACGEEGLRCCVDQSKPAAFACVDNTLYCNNDNPRICEKVAASGQPPVYCDGNGNATKTPSDRIYTALGCIAFSDNNSVIILIIKIALGVVGGIAILLIIVASIIISISGADPRKLQGGKELFLSAVIGLIMISFCVFILKAIGVSILGILK